MAGFEPATSCSQISSAQSPDVALCRLMWRSPGVIVAGRRLASSEGCARWLPLWLPPSAAQKPGSCLSNRTLNSASEIKIIRFPTTKQVKIADALTSTCLLKQQGQRRRPPGTIAEPSERSSSAPQHRREPPDSTHERSPVAQVNAARLPYGLADTPNAESGWRRAALATHASVCRLPGLVWSWGVWLSCRSSAWPVASTRRAVAGWRSGCRRRPRRGCRW
jgi:hypothetical protein